MFGLDERGKVRDRFVFPANNLVVTSIDIQSVEPVDQRTRDALQKSVQLAIEITTNSQEATARWVLLHYCLPSFISLIDPTPSLFSSYLSHEAERLEQKAKGALERQKITDEAEAEKARKDLLELQANR